MKVSNYNVESIIDNKCVIYNTLSRKYLLYDFSQKDYISNLLNNLNKDRYEIREGEILKKFIKNGIVVDDKLDEFEKVSYFINKKKYQEGTFLLVIVPTLDCNFRCTYCYEEHKKLTMNNEVIEKLINYVRVISKKFRTLEVSWFGGEPMLQYESMKYLTKKFQEICEGERCNYRASITSNGYLFDNEKIDELENLGIKSIQITLDGDKKSHDIKRPLENGKGTFDKILSTFIKIADKNIETILRINIDEDNKDSISNLFDMIPKDKRKNIQVSICNLFQNKEKINQYNLFKTAIDKGYKYKYIKNCYAICEASFMNSIMVHPNGKITACQTFAENGLYFGEIEESGKVDITNNTDFLRAKCTSALNSEKCRKCNLLPMCLGGCPYKRYEDNNICIGKRLDGMNLEDLIKLHIHYDLKNDFIHDENVI